MTARTVNSEYDNDLSVLAVHVLDSLVNYQVRRGPTNEKLKQQDIDYLARTLQRMRDGVPVKEQM